MTRSQLEVDVERFLDVIRRDDPGLRVELEFEQPPLDWIPPTEVPADHPLVAALLNAAEQVLGWRPRLNAFPGGTDASKFQGLAGIPTIPGFGPGWRDSLTAPTSASAQKRSRRLQKCMHWQHRPT